MHLEGDLVGAPGALDLVAVHLFRPGPALGSAQDDHGPLGERGVAGGAGFVLDLLDLGNSALEGGGHQLVHGFGIGALHEIGLVAVADEKAFQLVVADAREDGGVGDLVTVEVEDGQHGAVAEGVQELVGMPGGGQRAGLGFAIADHRGDDQVGVVEGGAEGVGEAVAEFAAFVDGAGGFGGAVAPDAAGERELFEELAHALLVLALVRIDLESRCLPDRR